MNGDKRTAFFAAIAVVVFLSCFTATAFSDNTTIIVKTADSETLIIEVTRFSDVPEDSWAAKYIMQVNINGLMQGDGNGIFGYGRNIKRSEFVAILSRMLQWDTDSAVTAAMPTDVEDDQLWYYIYVMQASMNEVIDPMESFRPNDNITREEMAVMLVKALGYDHLAHEVEAFSNLPFVDVTRNKGYIAVAMDIGMVNGISEHSFAPENPAKREEAAAMLMRVYERYTAGTDFFHGFYAFSSYSQKEYAAGMDAVTFGWSNLCVDNEGIWLNTSQKNDNQWRIPAASESIIQYLKEQNTAMHFGVYMDMSQEYTSEDGQRISSMIELLSIPENRIDAINMIIKQATAVHEVTGFVPYSGVTLDFEGIRASSKDDFTAFVKELKSALSAKGLRLYVAVQPAVYKDAYYDGYDFRTLGDMADKLILMAHDYHPVSMEGFVGTSWHRNSAITPFHKVYYSLKAITDKDTGVKDSSKVALAISFSSVGWEVEDDLLVSEIPVHPSPETISKRLEQPDTLKGRSATLRNPYACYTTEDGRNIFLWYEDAESINDKIQLAKMFGINGVSVWRLGTIPDYSGVYDVWSDSLAGIRPYMRSFVYETN